MNLFSEAELEKLRAALASSKCASASSTHGFYHYPARFSPEIARAVIEACTAPDDWIMDPFMGGGTTVVEALAAGRRVAGIDINSLAHFIAAVRTTLSRTATSRRSWKWVHRSVDSLLTDTAWVDSLEVANLPKSVDTRVSGGASPSATDGTGSRQHPPQQLQPAVSGSGSTQSFSRL